MSSLLHKLFILIAAAGGALFTFEYASASSAPLYHYVLLFFASWFLFYALFIVTIDTPQEAADKPTKKIRRKNKAAGQAAAEEL